MATATVYANVSGSVVSSSATYSTAVAGGGSLTTDSALLFMGREPNDIYQSFFSFDLSAYAGATGIANPVLSLALSSGPWNGAQNYNIRAYNFGASVTTADWVPGGGPGGTLLAHRSSTGVTVAGTYYAFTDDAMAAAITAALGGTLYLWGTTATSEAQTQDNLNTIWVAGTGAPNAPRLVFDYTAGARTGDVTMADRGSGGISAGTTTMTITPGSTFTVGSMGVMCLALDNAGSGGATPAAPTSVTDSVGNVWTRRLNPIYDPGTANAGVEVAVYTAPIVFSLGAANSIVVTWAGGVTVGSKAYTLQEVYQNGGTWDYVTGAAGTGAASGTPTVTTSSITSGDVVVGVGGAESPDTWAGDADTTNGSWSTHQHAGVGATTSAISITSQYKLVTATAAQTYNPTLTSADQILGWVQLRPNLLPRPERRSFALQAVHRAGSW